MKLSTRIYFVIAVLVTLALGVMGLGLYGIDRIGDAMADYNRISHRNTALLNIDKSALAMTIAEKNLILETDDAKLREIAGSPAFKGFHDDLERQIAYIRSTIAGGSAAWARELPDRLARTGRDFEGAVGTVAALALKNAARHALDEMHAMEPLWASYLEAVGPIHEAVRRQWEAEGHAHSEEVVFMLDLRSNRIAFQRDIQAVLTAESAAERNPVIADLRAVCDELLALLAKAPGIFAERNPRYGQTLRGQLDNAQRIKETTDRMIVHAAEDSRGEAVRHSTTEVRDARLAFEQVIEEALEKAETQLADLGRTADTLRTRLFWAMLAASLAGIAAAGIMAFLMVSGLTARLHRITGQLEAGADQVAAAARQISESSQQLAEGATEQAASLEQTSSALEQMASMTRQNADHAGRANGTSGHAAALFEKGSGFMRGMTGAMGEINDSSGKIGRVVKTIEELAFQTNLLALNAAVEAARAGEAGKGFAVVAEEVRNLAQRSAQAARDTTELIQTTVDRVGAGSAATENLGHSFEDLQAATKEVAGLVGQIATATGEQAQGVDQVNTAVAQMDKVTQRNAANAEESAAAASQLESQAAALKDMVAELVHLATGAAPAVGRFPAPPSPPVAARRFAYPASVPAASRAIPAARKLPLPPPMRPEEVIPLEEPAGGDGFHAPSGPGPTARGGASPKLWSNNYETGIPFMDEQHKELFRQLDVLLDPGQANRVPATLDFLGKYVVKHFGDEENAHRKSRYPKAANHKAMHDDFIKTYQELRREYDADPRNPIVTMRLSQTALKWLKEHIRVHDREFAAHHLSQGGNG